jgi:glycosyltransferase involved in cell wall biosynthesis
MKQRPHYLMEAFATAGHPVYFVDPGITEPRWEDGVRLVPSVTDVPAKGVILYIHFAPLVQLVQDFDHPVVIYDIYDDLAIFQADEDDVPISRRVATHHGLLMDSAAAVLVSGATLAARHGEERPDLLIVENGVDLQMFSSRSDRPEDFPAAEGPVIGYHGMVSYWFDFELLVAVARRKPEWTFVLVGPVDSRVAVEVKALGTCANILRLGEKPSSQIAAYVQHFDIGAIWFKVNGLTRAVNPLKMYECMAAGVPVVAPPLPACVAMPGVRVADDADAFAACIEAALAVAPGEADALRAAARGYSWQERITPLINWLDQHDLRRVPG